MRRQITNRFIRHARGASGPYTRKIGRKTFARAAVKRRNGSGNLWTDNPDDVGFGWTDNGNGTYTASGADGSSVSQNTQVGQLVDDGEYTVAFEVTGHTEGVLTIYLGAATKFEVYSVSANGSYSTDVSIIQPAAPAANLISLDAATTLSATVGNISVTKK